MSTSSCGLFTQGYSAKGNLSKFVTLLSIMLLSLESLVFALEEKKLSQSMYKFNLFPISPLLHCKSDLASS